MENNYIQFTKEMKKDYTILAPNMLPMHFELILQVMRNYGYNMELLRIVFEALITEAADVCPSF